ncbi:poly-gamma-glutamate hydrolase family protein [Natrialbaceae archaeon GCM10025810]|uniref:poly-gamma-glutamate hydrolase family protein n=1 Tax=Halovalidus salilacus TaxID=3075124 RepID=UPI00360F418A
MTVDSTETIGVSFARIDPDEAALHRLDPPNDHCCTVSQELLERADLDVGQQLRIGRADERRVEIREEERSDAFRDAIYTVAGAHARPDRADLRLTDGGLERIGIADPAAARGFVRPLAVHPSYDSPEAAKRHDEFVEFLVNGDDAVESSDSARTLVVAPHGGYVEYGTDRQAAAVATRLDALAWVCAGFSDGGAFDRWHVTSTAIHPRSFPALQRILEAGADRNRPFNRALALHGYGGDETLVGGTSDASTRAAVAEAIEARIPAHRVRARGIPPEYDGTAPENVLNRLAPEGRTIQLEQPKAVRTDEESREAIVDAVCEVFGERLER